MNTIPLTNQIQLLTEYSEYRNAQLIKKISGLNNAKAQKLVERELPEILALNFVQLQQCIQLRNQVAFEGANIFRQQIPARGEIISIMASLEELSKNRIAAALNMEHLAQQYGILITAKILGDALSRRKVRRMISDSDLAYFRSLPQDDQISVKVFVEALKPIPMSSI
ncbi:hypothetical protein [Paenibacillus sp. HW567]|uniref:hypothetical protein n=1 Tax=Paenibacillus sp. HW567 TaxID=1034769 RepID=UPI00036CD65A|nr:hypothetical protein [Paenibacillus sp. HW567]